MDALRSYLTTAMIASVISVICIQLTDERFRKYVKYLVGLCLLLMLTRPLLSLVSEIGDARFSLSESREETLTGDSAYLDLLGNQLCESIGDRVSIYFSLPRESIYVTMTLDTADLSALKIEAIDLHITQACDEELIAKTLSDEFACPVNVSEELTSDTNDG